MRGEVVFYRLFDIGASVDLDEIQKTIDMPFLSGRFPTERAAPRYARFAQPLLVFVDERSLATNLGPVTASIAGKLYAVGSLAVVVRMPFEAAGLRALRPYANLRIQGPSGEEGLTGYCARLTERIIEDLVPFLHDSYEVKVDPEPYTIYCVSVTETPVREFTTTWRREVTALLANDPRPEAISDEEVEDTWRNWFSYYQDDLVVLEWDAALVVEPSATYEDTLTVFELANLQLANLRMDLGEATFQVDNISKLWGDWFLGKVYRGCVRKFELDSWRKTVEEKMKDLSDIYEVAHAEAEARRLLVLEFLVVLLFAVDLILIAFRR